MTGYDCTQDVKDHVERVQYWVRCFVDVMRLRAAAHDRSKVEPPEKECFDRWTPRLREVKFGSDDYKAALAGMGEGLAHHYAVNRHHPEHYPNGVDGMTLHDLVEMYCDWLAAAQAKGARVDMAYLAERFNLSPQLVSIITNTLREDDFWNMVNGVPAGPFVPEGDTGTIDQTGAGWVSMGTIPARQEEP